MQYLHIKNLEKYHPGYKDRNLVWAKIHIKMIHGDPDCEMIENEIDWARLIKFILIELNSRSYVPLSIPFLRRKGFVFKHRRLANTLENLNKFIEIHDKMDTKCIQNVFVDKEKDKDKDKDIYMSFETELLNNWNSLNKKNNKIPTIRLVSDKRKKSIKNRLQDKDFVANYKKALEMIPQSSFLTGNSDSKWIANFDWFIKPDTYNKILEGIYNNREKSKQRKGTFIS